MVAFIDLPIGPRGNDGLPQKMGVDDYIVAYGEDAFQRLVDRSMAPPLLPCSLEEYRTDLVKIKIESVGQPGVYLDMSPTGAGKTHSDLPAAQVAKKSLTVVPTHKNGQEVQKLYIQSGLNAEAYPELNIETCQNYEEATMAIGSGLSTSAAVCPHCNFNSSCDYQSIMEAAEAADHRIATHKRAQLGMEGIAEGRRYITIHENPTDLLRPIAEITCGLDLVAKVAQVAKDNARSHENMDLYWFFWKMETAAHSLIEKLQQTDNTTPLDLPPAAGTPRMVDAKLFAAMQSSGMFPSADPVRVVKSLAAGDLYEIIVRVDRIFIPGGQTTVKKAIIAVWQTKLPDNATIWLNDATSAPQEIENLVGRPVKNKTPGGRLEQQHSAIQIPSDVKQSTSPGVVIKLLRGFFMAFPDPNRIGIICHRQHVSVIKGTAHKGPVLDEVFRRRIAKIEYYHSGEGRGSNRWLDECDMILVLGTPRVPPSAVKLQLIRTGRAAASARDGQWDRDYWSGVTTTGKRRTIQSLAYRDHDWYSAHRSLVHSELIQAVGRGRGICPNGIPVVVISNEPLGLPLLDTDIEPLSESGMKALKAIHELTVQNSKIYYLENSTVSHPCDSPLEISTVSTSEVAAFLNLKDCRTRRILADLLRRHLVERIGQRGGWKLTPAGEVICSSATPLDKAPGGGDCLSIESTSEKQHA